MLYSKKTEYLMESIRSGRAMARSEETQSDCGIDYSVYVGTDFHRHDVFY